MSRLLSLFALSMTTCLASCATSPARNDDANPLAHPSPLPFEAPPFDRLRDGDFRPAIEAAMRKNRMEIAAIEDDPAPPTFENTVVALERSGTDLTRASKVFFNLTSSNTDDALQAAKAALAPELAAHGDAIALDPRLFARLKSVHDRRASLGLDAESLRLVERYYVQFVRSGALLDEDGKDRLKALNEEEAILTTRFTDHVLKEVAATAIVVDDAGELDGLNAEELAAASAAATERHLDGKWVIALENHSAQTVLARLKDRRLRERVMRASLARNDGGPNDNRAIIARLAQLRAQKARLLGYDSWAAFVTADQMAGTPTAATALLARMTKPAADNARAEATKLQAMIDAQHGGFVLQAWDWDFYAEQVRKADYDFDESAIKPYLELDRVLQDGVFFASHAMYGLDFRERKDLPVYQPDVRAFEIADASGTVFAIFYADFYAHVGKNGGAWENSYVDQSFLLDQHPVFAVHLNVVKPAPGQSALLDFDEVTTLFHEFGHGLHTLLSRQRYPYFAGTSVSTDFVEFPSQFNENWALEPSVVASYARHFRTGAPMPAELVARLTNSRKFNQGYLTTEYLAAALLDLEWHSLAADAPLVTDVDAFERAALRKYGMLLPEVPVRYRSDYFSHIWDGGYSANYYGYLWAEVLAIDGYRWFAEHGGMTRDNGLHFRDTVLARGGSEDAAQLYRDFRGRDPDVRPLLQRRGLQ